MGYYGLGPGMNSRMPDQLTPLERALRALPLTVGLEALALLEKIMRNIIHNPTEEKFRQLNRNNDKLKPLIGNEAGLNILREMGWELDDVFCRLPSSVKLDFQQHVGKIIDAKDFYVKEIERAKKNAKREKGHANIESESCTPSTQEETAKIDPGKTSADAVNTLEPSAFEAGASSAAFCPNASVNTSSFEVADPEAPNLSAPNPCSSPTEPSVHEQESGISSSILALRAQRQYTQPDGTVRATRGATNEVLGISCDLGHPLRLASLRPHQGYIHRRECRLCGTRVERDGQWLRCEECRLSICALGRLRDTYCVCATCAQQQEVSHPVRGNIVESEPAEASPQALAPGMSASIRALRQNRYKEGARQT